MIFSSTVGFALFSTAPDGSGFMPSVSSSQECHAVLSSSSSSLPACEMSQATLAGASLSPARPLPVASFSSSLDSGSQFQNLIAVATASATLASMPSISSR